MALYEITRGCGHDEEIQIYGTNTRGQREWRAKQEARQDCHECLQAARDAINAEAGRVADETGLPPLTGSERQAAWAQTIRLQRLAQLGDAAERYARAGHRDATDEVQARIAAAFQRVLTRIAVRHTDARWWIDNQARDIAREVWAEATDTDRAEVLAAAADRQDLDEPATSDPDAGRATPDAPQAALAALRGSGWTVAKLAAEIGVHPSTVYRWAAGIHTPTPARRAALDHLARS